MVELLVAMVLSLLLLAGVGQIYLGNIQSFRLQDGQSRLQENARYATNLLSKDLRMAGSLGCLSEGGFMPTAARRKAWMEYKVPTQKVFLSGVPPFLVPSNIQNIPPAGVVTGPAISGGDNASGSGASGAFSNPNPSLTRTLNTDVVKGTDAITIQFAQSCNHLIAGDLSTIKQISADLPDSCTSYSSPVMITDCQKAHIFRPDKNNDTVLDSYKQGSEVLKYHAYTYYIRLNSSGEPALYRFDNVANTSDEIVEGIEDMQILYGIDANNDKSADQYLSAEKVDWSQFPSAAVSIVSIRVELRTRSVGYEADKLTSQPNPPRQFNGAALVDSRLLKNFTVTVQLRAAGL